MSLIPLSYWLCSSEEDEETPLDWLPYSPEVEEPEEPGWGQLEPALKELPSNKRACKDDGMKGRSLHQRGRTHLLWMLSCRNQRMK